MKKLHVASAHVTASFSLPVLLLTGATFLMTDHAFARTDPEPTSMQCRLIGLAVAQYGYAAARRHALETYGPEAAATGDKCFKKQGR